MKSRRHGTKPTLALWMLVAVADLAVLAAAAGPVLVLVLILLAILAIVVAGGRTFWPAHHRIAPRNLLTAVRHRTQTQVVRRRA